MNKYLLSDLHNEILKNGTTKKDAVPYTIPDSMGDQNGILVLCGDIDEVQKIEKDTSFLEEVCSRFHKVIYVLGNHEHYGNSINRTAIKLKEATSHINNLYVLHREAHEVGNTVFLGATLWTDYLGDKALMGSVSDRYKGGMRDFIKIKYNVGKRYSKLKYMDVLKEHHKDKVFLIDQTRKFKALGKKVIWAVHHPPSKRSGWDSVDKFGVNWIGAYCNDLDKLVEELAPEAVLHGHIHKSYSYKIGETWIYCNPYDYGLNPSFDPCGLKFESCDHKKTFNPQKKG